VYASKHISLVDKHIQYSLILHPHYTVILVTPNLWVIDWHLLWFPKAHILYSYKLFFYFLGVGNYYVFPSHSHIRNITYTPFYKAKQQFFSVNTNGIKILKSQYRYYIRMSACKNKILDDCCEYFTIVQGYKLNGITMKALEICGGFGNLLAINLESILNFTAIEIERGPKPDAYTVMILPRIIIHNLEVSRSKQLFIPFIMNLLAMGTVGTIKSQTSECRFISSCVDSLPGENLSCHFVLFVSFFYRGSIIRRFLH